MIRAYGGECACCGEDTPEFLTLDHIDPRKKTGMHKRTSNSVYCWLKRQGWPKKNLQILCFSCNMAKGNCGSCPHTWADPTATRARYLSGERLVSLTSVRISLRQRKRVVL